jgi:hypothetical protein
VSNRNLHATVATALLALAVALGYQHSPPFAGPACDCLSVSQAADARASDPAPTARVDVLRNAVKRTASRSKASGNHITETSGLLMPSASWQPRVEEPDDLRRVDHNASGHSGRAPPNSNS